MTDHKLIIEIEAYCTGENLDLRAVLNFNAIDKKVSLKVDEDEVNTFEAPVIRLRQDNMLKMYVTQESSRPQSQAVFKLRRIEFFLARVDD